MQKIPSDNRDKVLVTAIRLFTSKGYFNTSMRDITRESEVSTGSIYHYFKDKEGVAASLYQSMIDKIFIQFVSKDLVRGPPQPILSTQLFSVAPIGHKAPPFSLVAG